MSILSLAPDPLLPPPRSTASPATGRMPQEPGLAALTLGLLALVSAVHPLWALPSVGFGVAGAILGIVALLHRGERRRGAVGLLCALLGLAIASVTVPAAIGGAAEVLTWLAALRPEAA
ncbi:MULTISPECIES: hypothetical protein [unclassified Rathayibacter]|uniref:hypothetical protein n=1 Tax=unclassified Rathayibacter TaxID=2609250 RepID=UPI0006F7B30A|nr:MULTISPECIES: hypothetical protein [unclassified Rathayibacter]KQQ05431.1 hypothetical protein ASF42_02260 [Rathayibacter sp. Leaf294]KQS13294.1 hypothetical protein ASG06_02270 [Rathayibacter sp. Leaf185]